MFLSTRTWIAFAGYASCRTSSLHAALPGGMLTASSYSTKYMKRTALTEEKLASVAKVWYPFKQCRQIISLNRIDIKINNQNFSHGETKNNTKP